MMLRRQTEDHSGLYDCPGPLKGTNARRYRTPTILWISTRKEKNPTCLLPSPIPPQVLRQDMIIRQKQLLLRYLMPIHATKHLLRLFMRSHREKHNTRLNLLLIQRLRIYYHLGRAETAQHPIIAETKNPLARRRFPERPELLASVFDVGEGGLELDKLVSKEGM